MYLDQAGGGLLRGWTRPGVLDRDRTGDARDYLTHYFSWREAGAVPRFTGALFNDLGSDDSQSSANAITSDDIVAVSTLSVHIRNVHALQLLGEVFSPGAETATASLRGRGRIPSALDVPVDVTQVRRLFAELPTDLDLADATDSHMETAELLWKEVRRKHMGPTRVSKLLARKRPRLLPIIDSAVCEQLGHKNRTDFYESLRTVLQDEELDLPSQLAEIRRQAVKESGGDKRIRRLSDLRVFDIVLWMAEKHPTIPSA